MSQRQSYNFQGEPQAPREEQGQMIYDLPVAEGEGSNGNNSPSSTSPTTPRKMPSGGVPESDESPQRAESPPNVMASIPMSPTDEASGNQREELEDPMILHLNAKVVSLIEFLILKYRLKELTTKAEIIENIVKEDEQHYDMIFNQAFRGLKLFLGIDIIEVDPVVHTYSLVIALGITYDGMLADCQGMPKTGLLIVALGIIYMQGNHARENVIWRALNVMGIRPNRHHCIAGNAKKLFTETFVKEGYLEYNPVPGRHPTRYEFLWGPRAHAETTGVDVLQFLTRVNWMN
ncbi:hypothetical protein STEG23_026164 [Scotinomys teguina]